MNEEEMSNILENLLNASGNDFTESQLDAIDEKFTELMNLIFG